MGCRRGRRPRVMKIMEAGDGMARRGGSNKVGHQGTTNSRLRCKISRAVKAAIEQDSTKRRDEWMQLKSKVGWLEAEKRQQQQKEQYRTWTLADRTVPVAVFLWPSLRFWRTPSTFMVNPCERVSDVLGMITGWACRKGLRQSHLSQDGLEPGGAPQNVIASGPLESYGDASTVLGGICKPWPTSAPGPYEQFFHFNSDFDVVSSFKDVMGVGHGLPSGPFFEVCSP